MKNLKFKYKKRSAKDILKRIENYKFEELKNYFAQIEKKFEDNKVDIGKRYDAAVKGEYINQDRKDEVDVISDFYGEEFYTIEDIFIKTFRYSAIVSIYSFIESSMKSLAIYLQHSKNLSLKLEDLKGSSVIEKTGLYFEKVCLINFPSNTNEWAEIQKLNTIRNSIVHATGDIFSSNSKHKVENVINNTKGLNLKDERYIIINKEYLDSIISKIEVFVNLLYDRAFE
jgi:hypothetical protein